MKGCELCGEGARTYCESDQASLCWDCDEKVHSANFLVGKHSRSLLCQVCQSPTPWKASGPKLGPTVSVCQSCFSSSVYHGVGSGGGGSSNNKMLVERNGECREEHCQQQVGDAESEYEDDGFDDDDDDDSEEFDEEEEEEEDGDNQVVPWSSTSASSPAATVAAPPVASSSSSEGEIGSGVLGSSSRMKRMRDNYDVVDSDDEIIGCSSSHLGSELLMSTDQKGTSEISIRPLKQPRASSDVEDHGQAEESRSRAVDTIESLKRLQQGASATIFGVCRLSRDQSP